VVDEQVEQLVGRQERRGDEEVLRAGVKVAPQVTVRVGVAGEVEIEAEERHVAAGGEPDLEVVREQLEASVAFAHGEGEVEPRAVGTAEVRYLGVSLLVLVAAEDDERAFVELARAELGEQRRWRFGEQAEAIMRSRP
jgi:hypothetical protein